MARLGPAEKLLMATVPQTQVKLPTILLALAMVVGTAAGVRAATATWDANTEADLAGYKLSYGTQSGVHTVVLDVGKVTTYQFFPPPGRYYVVVQAYNTAGDLSAKSAEVVVVIPTSTTPPVPGHAQPPPPVPGPGQPPAPSPGGPPAPGPTLPPSNPTPQPQLVQPANQTTRVQSNAVLVLTVANPYGRNLTFSATGLPPGLSLDSGSGVIRGIPGRTGSYPVTVTVSDGVSSMTGNFMWFIVDTAPPGPSRP